MGIIAIPIVITVITFLGVMYTIGLMYCDLDKRLKKLENKTDKGKEG